MKLTRQLTSSLLLAACLCVVTVAHAEFSAPHGWYLEGNLGDSKVTGKSYPGNAHANGFGFNFNAGLKINPYIAGEIGYTNYAFTRINNYSGQQVAKDQHYSYDVAGKLIMPVGATGFEAFVKAGGAWLQTDLSVNSSVPLQGLNFNSGTHNTTGLFVGAGVDYTITPHILVNLQWQDARGNSSTGDLNLFSGGLSYTV
jgi:opacity protein-like surface antigen